MESIWTKPELSEAIIKNDDILEETQSIVADFMARHLDISILVENMAGVLTHKEPDNRLKGIRFFTKLLKELPKDYLSNLQVNFISTFYVDRLKDYHKVIPYVLEGYLSLVDMKNYTVTNSGDFFMMLFREVPCQSQVRQDRYNIYLIIQKIMDMDADYVSKLGPDFVYGVISSMDGERDPRNLMFMFTMLPKFIKTVQLGHLVNEMFEIMSCYFPVDFHPSPTDPAPVQRNDLAEALAPCLCAVQEFSEPCLLLLIEKLDSSLRVAKIDAFHLLEESCKTFTPESYGPFLKSLWSSLTREISHKSDEDLRMAAHEALFALVANQSKEPVDRFENFVKGIIIAMQTSIAEATTIAQFIQTTRVIATTANASQESSIIVTKCMIPSMIGYYGFQPSPKLQIASLDFLGELYELAKHWDILHEILKEAKDIPHVCLTAVSSSFPDMQYAGFKTLIKVKDVLDTDLVLPFVEVLIHNIQHSQSPALLAICVEAVHAIARKYPELIMGLVVKGKCDLDHLTQDKIAIEMRLNLLSNLASIDEFTKVIIQEMLKIIMCNDSEACRVVQALNGSISNTSLYTDSKVNQIESDHGLINSVLSWLYNEIGNSQKDLSHGYSLISNTVSSLSLEKQLNILSRHTSAVLEKCKENIQCFFVLEALYSPLHQGIHTEHFPEIMNLSLKLCLQCECEEIRTRACVVVAHFLNKVEPGTKYEYLYELLRNFLSSCDKDNMELCPKLITLYGWLTKALIMRGSDAFQFWLQKIMVALKTPIYCKLASESIKLITTDFPEFLTAKQHCRVSIFYKQRLAQTFISLLEKYEPTDLTKESCLLSWAYVLEKMPKSLLNSEANKITPLIVESLNYQNRDLSLVMLEVLSHYINTECRYVADSLQTLLPRLMSLTKFDAMNVKIKSLQCAYDIANVYPTVTLLPYKQDILLELAPSLDDKKRLVRAAAVKARTRWFMIGAPGEAKDE